MFSSLIGGDPSPAVSVDSYDYEQTSPVFPSMLLLQDWMEMTDAIDLIRFDSI